MTTYFVYFIALFISSWNVPLTAQFENNFNQMLYYNVDFGANSSMRGHANSTMRGTAIAAYMNPAGLASYSKRQFQLNHTIISAFLGNQDIYKADYELIIQPNFTSFYYVTRLDIFDERIILALSLKKNAFKKISESYRLYPNTINKEVTYNHELDLHQMLYSVSLAKQFDNLSAGITVSMYNGSYTNELLIGGSDNKVDRRNDFQKQSISNFPTIIDAGIQYDIDPTLRLGASIRYGTDLKNRIDNKITPITLNTIYKVGIAKTFDTRYHVYVDYHYYGEQNFFFEQNVVEPYMTPEHSFHIGYANNATKTLTVSIGTAQYFNKNHHRAAAMFGLHVDYKRFHISYSFEFTKFERNPFINGSQSNFKFQNYTYQTNLAVDLD